MLILIGICGVALAGLLVGLSPTYIVLITFLVLVGVTGGGYHPSAAPMISAAVEPERRGRALGIHQIGGTVSHLIAPLIAVAIAAAIGWRGSFIGVAVPLIVFGVAFYIILGRWGYSKNAEQEASESQTGVPVARSRLRNLIAFLVMSVAGQALIFSAISFLPLYLVDNFGASEEAAAALLALAYSAGLVAGPLGGYLTDRLGGVPVMVVVNILAGPVIYLLNLAPYGWSLFIVLFLVGLCMDIRMPVSEAYIISNTPERKRSTVMGIYYFASRGGPGLVTPLLGYSIDQFGFYNSFSIIGAVMIVITLGCAGFLWSNRD